MGLLKMKSKSWKEKNRIMIVEMFSGNCCHKTENSCTCHSSPADYEQGQVIRKSTQEHIAVDSNSKEGCNGKPYLELP